MRNLIKLHANKTRQADRNEGHHSLRISFFFFDKVNNAVFFFRLVHNGEIIITIDARVNKYLPSKFTTFSLQKFVFEVNLLKLFHNFLCFFPS